MRRLVAAARAGGLPRPGDIDVATRCELALRDIARPTPEQRAGAELICWHREDQRVLALGMTWKTPGQSEEE